MVEKRVATASAHDTLTNTLSYHQHRPSHQHSRSHSTSNTLLNCTNGLGLSLDPNLAYPPPIFSASKSGQVELDDILMQKMRDSWAKLPDRLDYGYEATTEQYRDAGRPIPVRRARSMAVDELPFENSRKILSSYSVETRRRRSDHVPVDRFASVAL